MSSHSPHVKPKARKKLPPTYGRSLSASEYEIHHIFSMSWLIKVYFRISRNIGNFETWSTYQGCEQVSYSDIPEDLGQDVTEVFDLSGRLPIAWTQKVQFQCNRFKYLKQDVHPVSSGVWTLPPPEAICVPRTSRIHRRRVQVLRAAVL